MASASTSVGKPVAVQARPTLEEVIRSWAAGLTPANAPDGKYMGPLAWVRGKKVDELVELTKGYK